MLELQGELYGFVFAIFNRFPIVINGRVAARGEKCHEVIAEIRPGYFSRQFIFEEAENLPPAQVGVSLDLHDRSIEKFNGAGIRFFGSGSFAALFLGDGAQGAELLFGSKAARGNQLINGLETQLGMTAQVRVNVNIGRFVLRDVTARSLEKGDLKQELIQGINLVCLVRVLFHGNTNEVIHPFRLHFLRRVVVGYSAVRHHVAVHFVGA